MVIFLKMQDEIIWNRLDNEGSETNAKALYCIFKGVSPNKFHKIATCKYTKKAWDNILSITHEGTSTMKLSKLQILTMKFESMKMKDNKTFSKFYTKLSDIVNSYFSIGETILDSKVVRKIKISS